MTTDISIANIVSLSGMDNSVDERKTSTKAWGQCSFCFNDNQYGMLPVGPSFQTLIYFNQKVLLTR